MARLFQMGFEAQDTLGITVTNGSITPVVSYPTPGRSGITGTRYRRVVGNGFGSGNMTLLCTFTPSPEIYFQVVMAASGGTSGTGIQIRDASGNQILLISAPSPGGTPSVTLGASTSLGACSEAFGTSFRLIEVHLKIDTVSGELDIKFDGTNVLSFAGDTDPSSRPNAAQMLIFAGNQSTTLSVDDWIINNADNSDGKNQNSWIDNASLLGGFPNADGDSSDLTNSAGNSTSNYSYVDEAPYDSDSTYVAADTAAEKDLYNIGDLPTLPAGSTIRSVRARFVCKRADPGTPSDVLIGIKSGTAEDFAAAQALSTSYAAYYGDIYVLDPDDSAAWDETKINALQIGVESA